MGRPELSQGKETMYQLLVCWVIIASISCDSATATSPELPIYPADQWFANAEASAYFRQLILSQLGRRHLRLKQLVDPEPEPLPQFTYHFPEHRNQEFQSDLFAVPPSDPRYYQKPPVSPAAEEVPTQVLEDKREQAEDVEVIGSNLENGGMIRPLETSTDQDSTEHFTSETPEDEDNDVRGRIYSELLPRNSEDIILVAIIAGCGAAAAAGVVALSIGWYKLHNNSKLAADIEYPAYGVTGPNKEISPTGDRRLAQSAQMYHYQHQKQQIIAMESNRANNERRGSVSEGDSDEENEEGDYTVYECPGLAATGELEVKNPLFLDDPTPATVIKAVEQPAAPEDKK